MRRALAVGDEGLGDSEDENNLLDDDFVMQAAGADDVSPRRNAVTMTQQNTTRRGVTIYDNAFFWELNYVVGHSVSRCLVAWLSSPTSPRLLDSLTHAQDEGFDFDAHVARLMEASAREMGLRQRNADDDLETKGLARLRRDSDDSDGDDDDGVGSDDSGEIDDALLEGLNIHDGGVEEGGGVAGGGAFGEGTEERAVLDSQFEAVSFGVGIGVTTAVAVVVGVVASRLPLLLNRVFVSISAGTLSHCTYFFFFFLAA